MNLVRCINNLCVIEHRSSADAVVCEETSCTLTLSLFLGYNIFRNVMSWYDANDLSDTNKKPLATTDTDKKSIFFYILKTNYVLISVSHVNV